MHLSQNGAISTKFWPTGYLQSVLTCFPPKCFGSHLEFLRKMQKKKEKKILLLLFLKYPLIYETLFWGINGKTLNTGRSSFLQNHKFLLFYMYFHVRRISDMWRILDFLVYTVLVSLFFKMIVQVQSNAVVLSRLLGIYDLFQCTYTRISGSTCVLLLPLKININIRF